MLTVAIHQPEPLQLECSWRMFMFLDRCKTNPFYLILQQTTNVYAANYCVSVERAVTSGRGHAHGLKLASFVAYRHLLSATAHLQDHPHWLVQAKLLPFDYLYCHTTSQLCSGASIPAEPASKRGPLLQGTSCPSRCQRQQVEEHREPARQQFATSASDLCAS